MEYVIYRALLWKVPVIQLILSLLLVASCWASNTLKVCGECEYQSIQAALDAAPVGARVQVGSGTYREPKTIRIQKSVQLMGEGWPVIDGQSQQQILAIFKTPGVEITGFIFKDTGVSFTSELAALRVIESEDCFIHDNLFVNSTYGIYLEKSYRCNIKKNQFQGQAKDESSGGNGIHVWTGSDHRIEENEITGQRDGIYLEFVKNSKLRKNKVYNNLRYGLHFMFSNSTHATENVFSFNGSGVAIMYSQDIIIEDNSFRENKGNASYGLLLKDIQASKINRNQFIDNTVGIYMEGSNRSFIQSNDFFNNGYALRIMGNCENNEFEHNNFLANSFDVTTNTSMSWNTFKQNFWSKYLGYDLDRDGLGDVPFRPVSLSSVVAESVDSSFYLIGSLLFDLLDFVERALPELTPEPLKDESPLIIPRKVLTRDSN